MQLSENCSSEGRVKSLFLELQEKKIIDKKIKLSEDKKIGRVTQSKNLGSSLPSCGDGARTPYGTNIPEMRRVTG